MRYLEKRTKSLLLLLRDKRRTASGVGDPAQHIQHHAVEQVQNEELHQKQMQELEQRRVQNERAVNERLLAAQREQARAADRRLEQEQARQRRAAEKTRIEADKARQTEDARRRRREYAANQIKLARNQQSKDYWESEWKRNL